MKVLVPDVLLSYTERNRVVQLDATDVNDLFNCLNARYPGLRFRVIIELDQIRPHIKLFVNRQLVHKMDSPLKADDEVMIVQALSGG